MRLLFVDDNRAILAGYAKLLRKRGFVVFDAISGEEALQLLDLFSVDAALVDYHLPDMTGENLIKIVKRRQPSIRAVCWSGTPIHGTTFDAYLSKPAGLGEIIAAIRGTLS